RAVVDARRDAQPDPPLGLQRPTTIAARARLLDAGRAPLDPEDLSDVDPGHRPLPTRPEAVLALGVRKAEGATAHAGCAADCCVEGEQPACSLLRLEAAHLQVGPDVRSAHDLGRTSFRFRSCPLPLA